LRDAEEAEAHYRDRKGREYKAQTPPLPDMYGKNLTFKSRVTLTMASRSCCMVGLGFSIKPNFPSSVLSTRILCG